MKVSVIIPVYNVKPYLERCVQSVLNQTYKDLEIILIDDGSTDGSGELCDQLSLTDRRIRTIHQNNQGLSGARNSGIQDATGDYIIFLDSDDEWLLDDGLETLLQEGNTKYDLILFKNVDIWSNGRETYSKDYDVEVISTLPDAQSIFSHLVLTQQFRMSACFLLVRRELLLNNNLFFPEGYISEDLFWSLHLWQYANSAKIVNLKFYGYYHRGNSITTTPSIRVYESYDKIFTYWKEQCNKNCINAQSIRIYLANMWVSRGYAYHKLKTVDKPIALSFLKTHADLLRFASTPKAQRVKKAVMIMGVHYTVLVLGVYWRLRTIMKRHVV